MHIPISLAFLIHYRIDNILKNCLFPFVVCGNVHSLLPLYSCQRFGISFWFVCTLAAHICIAFYLRVSGIVAPRVVVIVVLAAAVAVARSSFPLHLPCAICASWSDTSTLYFRYFFSISLAFPLAVISIFVLPRLCCSPINIFVEHAILRCLLQDAQTRLFYHRTHPSFHAAGQRTRHVSLSVSLAIVCHTI